MKAANTITNSVKGFARKKTMHHSAEFTMAETSVETKENVTTGGDTGSAYAMTTNGTAFSRRESGNDGYYRRYHHVPCDIRPNNACHAWRTWGKEVSRKHERSC